MGSGLNKQLLDSLNFLNMPLSQLPKRFGLVEMKKGYFSYLYNTEDNNMLECKKHLMHLPDPSYYDIDNMHNEVQDKFLQWYKIHGEEPFDMDRELLEYYHSDVDILLNACWKFRKLFMDIMGPHHPIDPFDYITIASFAWEPSVPNLRNGQYCIRRMHKTSTCIGYGIASVPGSRQENGMAMHPSKSTWGMEAGQK